jgi:hypothetical protein
MINNQTVPTLDANNIHVTLTYYYRIVSPPSTTIVCPLINDV